jgi:hypothetical protein
LPRRRRLRSGDRDLRKTQRNKRRHCNEKYKEME